MTRRRICLSDSLGEHCRGGPGSLHFYSSVMTPHSVYPVREFTVSEVRPYAQHDRSVTITFIEPRKRKKKYTTVVPDNVRYVAIEANGEFVYDSRADVPCHMGDFRATRARFDIQDADEGPPEPEPPVKPMTRAEMHTHAIAEKEGDMTEDRSDELREWYAEDDIDGAVLLDDLLATLTRYVVFPDQHSKVAVALWIATTHALPAFECAPRLVITSPEKRCGKTRLLDIITGTCHKPLATVNATVAAIFRSIGGTHPPTIVVDEADTIFGSKKTAENNEDFRALLNAGHQRGRPALRCVGPLQVPTEFSTFAMCALAGIGTMPDTITDRAVNISMRRRASGETVAQFRSRRDGPILAALRDRLSAWAAQRIDELTKAEPDMPVEDRAADTFEPLIVVADAAGGHWPDTARAACKALVDAADEADEERSLNTKLLADIKTVFTSQRVSFLPSAELVAGLRRIEDAPWDDFEFTTRKLAYRLKEFGVKPGRAERNTVRGYALEAFADAFSRYIRPQVANPSTTGDDQQQREDGSKSEDGSILPHENIRPQETAGQPPLWTDWTDEDGCPTGNGSAPRESGRNSAPNHSRFTPDPPCFHCDKPVVSKTTDSQGRYAHLGCQTNQPQPEGLIT